MTFQCRLVVAVYHAFAEPAVEYFQLAVVALYVEGFLVAWLGNTHELGKLGVVVPSATVVTVTVQDFAAKAHLALTEVMLE